MSVYFWFLASFIPKAEKNTYFFDSSSEAICGFLQVEMFGGSLGTTFWLNLRIKKQLWFSTSILFLFIQQAWVWFISNHLDYFKYGAITFSCKVSWNWLKSIKSFCVLFSDGWSTMTTKFVPQKGPLKTWATCTFTAGYQAKPQTYKLARRSHTPF